MSNTPGNHKNTPSIWDTLAQDARVMRSARMLPTDRVLTPEEIRAIARDVRRYAKETNRSEASIARAIGCAASQMSEFLNDKGKCGDREDLARQCNEYIEREARKREQVAPKGFVETNVAERMMTAIKKTMQAESMGMAYGAAGIGKTIVADAAEKMIAGAILIRVRQSTRRGTGMSSVLAAKLGIGSSQANAFDKRQTAIVDHLRGLGRLIIVDEAHQLRPDCLEFFRDIHDETGCPIFFIGTVDLRKRFDDSSMFYGQFSSRCAVRLEIDAAMTRTKNPRPLFTTDEVLHLFAGQQLKLTSDGASFLTDLANTPGLGALRLVKQVVGVAATVAKKREQAIDARLLRNVLATLHDATFLELIEARGERSGLKVAYA